jgi:hypothetical protein
MDGRKASVVLVRQRRSGKPTVQVHAGSARQNVDRVVDEQAKLSDRKRPI